MSNFRLVREVAKAIAHLGFITTVRNPCSRCAEDIKLQIYALLVTSISCVPNTDVAFALHPEFQERHGIVQDSTYTIEQWEKVANIYEPEKLLYVIGTLLDDNYLPPLLQSVGALMVRDLEEHIDE